MTLQTRWALISWITGGIVAAVLVLVFEVPIGWALMILGAWVMAGAALRILRDYVRVRREVDRNTPEV